MNILKAALLPIALPAKMRFTAGTSIPQSLRETEKIRSMGAVPILNYLGEHLQDPLAVHEQLLVYLELLDRLVPGDRIAVKPSQLGLDIPGCGAFHVRNNMDMLMKKAEARGVSVELDMENAVRADATVNLAVYANRTFSSRTRLALSARMLESSSYVGTAQRFDIPLRLVKGAYEDPEHLALTTAKGIEARYKIFITELLTRTRTPAFATHDLALITYAIAEAERLNIPKNGFELQFLKGFCPKMQKDLAAKGYQIAVYIPFGPLWFEYGLRRWKFFRRSPKKLFRALLG